MAATWSASSDSEPSIASDDFEISSVDGSAFDQDDDDDDGDSSGSYAGESATDVDGVVQWSQGELMQYFENVSKRELLNGGKAIRFSARSIRTMLVFCARHQVSVRNQPSPALLNRLLGALDVPDDASARLWEVIGVKVLRAIDYHVSSNVQNQALREARGKDGVWRCTWKEWSKRWLQRDWDGEVQQPADVEEREQHERPVVRLRHALNRDQLAAAAAALRRRESGDAVDDEESDDVDDEQSGDADDEESGDAEDEESEDADDEQSDDE